MTIALQQVQLADWVERGMQQDTAALVGDMHAWLQTSRAIARSESEPKWAARTHWARSSGR